MFDMGFWELATIGIIALIVLGPERLPVMARTLGRWVGQAKGYMGAVTSELEKEVHADEIRNEVRRAREQIESETRSFESDTRSAVEPVMRPLDGFSERNEPAYSADDDVEEPEESEEADDSRMSLFSDNPLPLPDPPSEDDDETAPGETDDDAAPVAERKPEADDAPSEKPSHDQGYKPAP